MIGEHIGRFQIVEELGSGGMATVYRALDLELGREVAIKAMHPHLAKKEEYAERFRREARAVAALSHPNVIEIFDFVRIEEAGRTHAFIVSELIDGPTLSRFLQPRRRVLPEVAALIGAKLASALACAHDAGIVHRDVKPENVLVGAGGRIVLTDFGIARVLEGETVTATGSLVGSPAYMSPEQARGQRPSRRSDLFSLGSVLYRLATGRLAFPGRDPLAVISNVVKGRYLPAQQVEPAVGSELDAIIRRCLQTEPEDRPESAAALAEELAAFASSGGLGDADQTLNEYFAEPDTFEERAVGEVVTRLLGRAQELAERRHYAKALALADRTLALDPDNESAIELVRTLSERRTSWRWLWVVAAGVLLVGLGIGAWQFGWFGGGGDRRGPIPTASAPRGDAAIDDAAVADAVADGGGDAGADRSADGALVVSRAEPDAAPGPGPPPSMWAEPRPRPRVVAPSVDAATPAVVTTTPDAGPTPLVVTAPRFGWLRVAVLPYCDLSVNGASWGRSPMPRARKVPAGTYAIACHHAVSGRTFRRTVTVVGDGRVDLRHALFSQVRVTVRLSRGDSIRVGGVRYRPGVHRLLPRRQAYVLLRQGQVVERGWVTIPPRPCRLADAPRVGCY